MNASANLMMDFYKVVLYHKLLVLSTSGTFQIQENYSDDLRIRFFGALEAIFEKF